MWSHCPLTYAGGQWVVPGAPLACHALEHTATMQRVAGVALVGDGASGEVTLVIDLVAKLGHTWILAVGELETCEQKVGLDCRYG